VPTYEYRCDNGHTFEVVQRMSDDPITECTVCGAPVQRVFHPVAVHFKGSGFYTTDYGKKKGAGAGASSGDSSGSDSKDSGSKDSGSKDSGSKDKSEKKSEKTSSGSSGSGSD
jgi:putative FmdB family regulatory protein